MSETLKLKVLARKGKDGSESFEGTVTLPTSSLAPTKVQKADGTTKFSTRSAVVQAAKAAAKKMGCELTEETQPIKKAAKKATKKSPPSTPKVTPPGWLNS